MKTQQAIDHAGSARALADLLGITPSAISQWGEDVPESRYWQMQVLRPDWFKTSQDTWDGSERRSKDRPSSADHKARAHG